MTGAEQARALADLAGDLRHYADREQTHSGLVLAHAETLRDAADQLDALSAAEAALREAREALVGLHTLEDQYEDAIQKLREAREALREDAKLLRNVAAMLESEQLSSPAMRERIRRAAANAAVLARDGEQT